MFTEAYREDLDSKKKLEDLIHLAELCIEVLQQNEEHHAEVSLSDLNCSIISLKNGWDSHSVVKCL